MPLRNEAKYLRETWKPHDMIILNISFHISVLFLTDSFYFTRSASIFNSSAWFSCTLYSVISIWIVRSVIDFFIYISLNIFKFPYESKLGGKLIFEINLSIICSVFSDESWFWFRAREDRLFVRRRPSERL